MVAEHGILPALHPRRLGVVCVCKCLDKEGGSAFRTQLRSGSLLHVFDCAIWWPHGCHTGIMAAGGRR